MKQLDEGILFEDTGQFLKWGKSASILAENIPCKIEEHGDRTIYRWGTHKVLKGLELQLQNSYWLDEKQIFNSIDFWTVGDTNSTTYFQIISKHLTELFGPPTNVVVESEPEGIWTWKTNSVSIRLHLFEQHVYKLVLTIEKERKNVLQQLLSKLGVTIGT